MNQNINNDLKLRQAAREHLKEKLNSNQNTIKPKLAAGKPPVGDAVKKASEVGKKGNPTVKFAMGVVGLVGAGYFVS